jgi:hypothetical protein
VPCPIKAKPQRAGKRRGSRRAIRHTAGVSKISDRLIRSFQSSLDQAAIIMATRNEVRHGRPHGHLAGLFNLNL